MVEKKVHSVEDEDKAADATIVPSELRDCPLRSYDAWALPVDVLLKAVGVTSLEADVPESVPAILMGRPGETYIVTAPGLDEGLKEHLIRELLGKYLVCEPSALRQGNASDDETANPSIGTAVDSVADPPPSWKPFRANVPELYGQGHWAPMHGWRTDDEVIDALKAMIAEHLDGAAIDIPDNVDFPESAGGAVAWACDEEDKPHPLVLVREDLPSGLRADLWGFCIALVAGAESDGAEPDDEGFIYVGCERSPVTGPGVGLLGALMVQRMGRRPGDCSFPILNQPTECMEGLPKAA